MKITKITPPIDTVTLWSAMKDSPHVYGVEAAKGALRSLQVEIERAERGEPPLFVGDAAEREARLRREMPGLFR